MRALVTGGFGFIASELTERLIARGETVMVMDSMTYAADPANLATVEGQFEHVQLEVQDPAAGHIIRQFKPDVIFHAAAESHVDRSIQSYYKFTETNLNGTWNLLEACRDIQPHPLMFYVSTDEVYGSIQLGRADEDSPLNPSNPYSVTKAASEHAVRAGWNTWRIPYLITRSCNNYGPRQHPEKLIPRIITSLLSGQPIPLHGDGRNVREWIHVSDNVSAMLTVLDKGSLGCTYNITSGVSATNLEIIGRLAESIGPANILHVPDRPGNDYRYAMTSSRLHELGWSTSTSLADGLRQTADWYRNTRKWWGNKADNA